TLEPSDRFAALIRDAAVVPGDVGRSKGAETVILKAASTQRGGAKLLIDYRDTPETRRLRAEMERINTFLGLADVTIAGRPQLQAHLARQFQIAAPDAPHRFEAHGRLYGSSGGSGWWI